MPDIDIRRKYTRGRKKKKESLAVSLASGLLPWKGDAPSDAVRKVVFLVSVCALTFALIMILNFYFGEHEEDKNDGYFTVTDDGNDKVKITVPTHPQLVGGDSDNTEVEILKKYKHFYEDNPEFVGYLSIDKLNINYPVVQSQGDKPNDWYLTHDFDGSYTKNGTIFADKFGDFTPTARPHNTIIHGHNLQSKNKFQPLMNYRDSATTEGFPFLQEHPIIKFDTLYEPGVYKIFAVFQTHVSDTYGKYFDYWRRIYFSTKDDFYSYTVECLDRSLYHTDVDLQYGDELLTLSTCDFSILPEMRLVIVARRVREGESADMDADSFVNYREDNGKTPEGFMKYKMFDAFYRMNNNNKGWAGRHWDISRVQGLSPDWLYAYDEYSGFY